MNCIVLVHVQCVQKVHALKCSLTCRVLDKLLHVLMHPTGGSRESLCTVRVRLLSDYARGPMLHSVDR